MMARQVEPQLPPAVTVESTEPKKQRRKPTTQKARDQYERAEVKKANQKVKEKVVRAMLQSLCHEHPEREGLLETPRRVVEAWKYWCSGYDEDPMEVLQTFEDGAESYDQLVTVAQIPVWSHCEHHLAPFFGQATVAYLPNGRIIGLSKIVRVVEIYARRLQVQERLTQQIATALHEALRPRGVGVILECRHLCMESRGVRAVGTITRTSALRGLLLKSETARAEFLRLAGGL